mgnify:CR=1 FL=1
MKKLLGIVLTLLLLISLMACAAKENVDTQVPMSNKYLQKMHLFRQKQNS